MPDKNKKHADTTPEDAEHTKPDDRDDETTDDSQEALGTPEPSPPDPFDPARLRLSQNFDESLSVKKVLSTIRVNRPSKEAWIRTHPDPAYRLATGIIDLKDDRKLYLVNPELRPHLLNEPTFGPRELVTAITRQNVLFLWPLRLPAPDGRFDDWGRSAIEAAHLAMTSWVRVTSNMDLGAYETRLASEGIPDPEWPQHTMGELLAIAFRDTYVDDINHSVLKQLRGEQ